MHTGIRLPVLIHHCFFCVLAAAAAPGSRGRVHAVQERGRGKVAAADPDYFWGRRQHSN